MPDFLSTIVENHQKVSPGFVETLIRIQREELFTGLMRLRYPSGEQLVLVFLNGTQQKLYHPQENSTDIVPRQTWSSYLDRADASVGSLALSAEALRFLRVAYEAPVRQRVDVNLSSSELETEATRWSQDLNPSLIHVRTDDTNRLYLIPGNVVPFLEELIFVQGKALFGMSDVSFPSSLPGSTPGSIFHVTRYTSDPDHELWQEYRLRHAFTPLMRLLFIRFNELAGRVLTERLCEQLSAWTRDGGLDMTVTGNGISNQHYFETLGSASDAYLGLARRFHYEASPAIGSRMADGISRDVLLKLDPYSREILNRYIYNKIGQENTVIRTWR